MLLLAACVACREAPRGLVVANGDDVSLLDPQRTGSLSDARILAALHTGLTRLDPRTLEPQPALATEFRAEDGARRWVFRLRPGLRWSDGAPLDAGDFVRSWQRLRAPEVASPWVAWLEGAAVTRDGDRLTVAFPRPRPRFAELCAFPALAPVPAHAPVEEVGTGPFRLVDRAVRDRVRVEANPHHWDADAVTLEAIDFLTVESQVTALNLFLAGEVVYAPNAPQLAVPALLRERPDAFRPTPQFATTFLRFNVTAPPFDDVRVRRAFAAAVDAEQIARVLGGVRPAATTLVPPLLEDWVPPPTPAWRRPGAAPALPAGLDPGTVQVELLYNSSELNRDVAEVLQDQWRRRLGVPVRLANQEWKTFLAAQRGLDYQVSRSSWIADYLDPIAFLEIFRSADGNNRTGWAHPAYDGLIEQARGEADPAARRLLLREAERLLLDQAVIVPLYHEASLELVDPRLKGFHRNLRGWIDWGRLSWQEDEA